MFPHYFQVVKVVEVEVITMTARMVEGIATDVLIPLVPLYLVLMILTVMIPMESEFLVSIFMSSKNCYHIRVIITCNSYFVQPTF